MAVKPASKTSETEAEAPAPVAAPAAASAPAPMAATVEAENPMTLDDFCAQLSETHKQPFAITPFFNEEREAGRLHDTKSAYQQRFAAMLRRPAQRG